jgi:PAS domain S-box-containing protein
MKSANKAEASTILRQKAEALMNNRTIKKGLPLSEIEAIKLVHELEVYQIELELQNEELFRAKAEAAELATEKYAELYDFAPSGYFTLSREGNIIELNLCGSQMLGIERSRLKNSPFGFFVSNETRPAFNHFLGRVFNSKEKETCELTLTVKDNAPVYVHLTGVLTENETQCLVTVVDITQIKELTELNEILLSSLPHPAMYIRRKDRVILAANKIASDLGVKIGGNCWREFMKTNFVSEQDQEILAKYPHIVPAECDIKCSFCLGDQCFSAATEQSVPEVHAFDQIWNTFWVKVSDDVFLHYAVNITEHKQAEEALRQSEEKYHDLFANNPQPMWIYDLETLAFLEVNDAAVNHYGYSEAEFLSMTIKDIRPAEDIPALLKDIDLISKGYFQAGEWRHIKKNGEVIIVEITSHSVISNGRKARHVLVHDITKSKKAEEALNYEQYLLQTLMNNAPASIYFKDCESRFIRINKAQTKLFGLSDPKQAIGKTDFDFFTEEHAKLAYEDEQKIIRTGQTINLEEKETWPDHADTWVSTSKMPLRDKEQKIIGTFGISMDITTRRSTEEVLRKSEERYRTLIENMGEGVGFLDVNETFVFANRSAEKIFGIDEGKLAGLCLNDFVVGENVEILKNEILKRIQGKNSVYEHEIVLKDGSKKDILISATPNFEDGKFIGTFAIFRDFTDYKQVVETLRISEERLELFFSQSLDGFFFMMLDEPFYWNDTTDKEKALEYTFAHQRITKINDAMLLQYLGTRDQFVGLTPNDLFAHDIEYGKRTWQELFDKGRLHIETDERRLDGSKMWVEGDYNCLYDSKKRIIGHFGIQRDVTDRKQAEDNLRKSEDDLRRINDEKDKFFSIIAHDLRSPFNGFLGLTEIMAEGMSRMTLEEIQKMATVMRNSATNLFRLLGNLLEWSRMQRGLTTFVPETCLVISKISESMMMVQDAADKKEITINYDVPEDLMVFTDGNMFGVIIRNLVTNAVKFTPKGGCITVSAKSVSDNSVEISIMDMGIGMDVDIIDNLFRLDINTSRKGTEGESSTGLGLIICKDYVEKHGGKLMVESEEGKGSTFRFTLPGSNEEMQSTEV